MTPTQVLSCEYCEIFENTNFEEHLQAVASEKTAYVSGGSFEWQFFLQEQYLGLHSGDRVIFWVTFTCPNSTMGNKTTV